MESNYGSHDVDDLYTEQVEKLMYDYKTRLPADFPLVTEQREVFIIIVVKKEHFDWRTVEDRLAIAIELEGLKNAIQETGIGCLIEKTEPED